MVDHGGAVMTYAANKRLTLQMRTDRHDAALGLSMFKLATATQEQDQKEHPEKQMPGNVFMVSQHSYMICTQELAGRVCHIHLDDMAKVVALVTGTQLLLPGGHADVHVFVYGAEHPDKKALIMVMVYLTMESTHHSLYLGYVWARGKYYNLTGKKVLHWDSWTADQGANISALVQLH